MDKYTAMKLTYSYRDKLEKTYLKAPDDGRMNLTEAIAYLMKNPESSVTRADYTIKSQKMLQMYLGKNEYNRTCLVIQEGLCPPKERYVPEDAFSEFIVYTGGYAHFSNERLREAEAHLEQLGTELEPYIEKLEEYKNLQAHLSKARRMAGQ